MIFFASNLQLCCLAVQGSPTVMQHIVSVESRLCSFKVLCYDSFVYRDD